MSVFDKFDKMFKKNAFDEKVDKAFDTFFEKNPITVRAKSIIEGAANDITDGLEDELYGFEGKRPDPDERPSILDDPDAVTKNWDNMFEQIWDRELKENGIDPKDLEIDP